MRRIGPLTLGILVGAGLQLVSLLGFAIAMRGVGGLSEWLGLQLNSTLGYAAVLIVTAAFLLPALVFGVFVGARERRRRAWAAVGLAVVGLIPGAALFAWFVLDPSPAGIQLNGGEIQAQFVAIVRSIMTNDLLLVGALITGTWLGVRRQPHPSSARTA